MYLNGSWLPNEVKNQTPEDFKWGAFSLPQIAEGGDGAESNQYGAQCFAINKDTKYPNAAFALIQWLTSGEWDQKLADASMGVPMDNNATWPAALADAKAVLDSTTHRLNWAVGMENDTNVNAAIKTNMAMMISGSVNAQQFADAFAKIHDRFNRLIDKGAVAPLPPPPFYFNRKMCSMENGGRLLWQSKKRQKKAAARCAGTPLPCW